jgi:hypothetical protein
MQLATSFHQSPKIIPSLVQLLTASVGDLLRRITLATADLILRGVNT